jgi:hypothetical protein
LSAKTDSRETFDSIAALLPSVGSDFLSVQAQGFQT